MKKPSITKSQKSLSKSEVTIFTPFSGRWACIYQYFKSLSGLDMRDTVNHILFWDNSNDEDFSELLKKYLAKNKDKYKTSRYIKDPSMTFAGVKYKEDSITRIMNEMRSLIKTKYLFGIEDDIVTNSDAFKKLFKIISSDPKVGFIQGATLSRWDRLSVNARYMQEIYSYPLNGKLQAVMAEYMPLKQTGIDEIGSGGFTCFITRKKILDIMPFKSEFNERGEIIHGPDILFGLDLNKAGWKVLIDWSVKCNHLIVNADDLRTEIIRC